MKTVELCHPVTVAVFNDIGMVSVDLKIQRKMPCVRQAVSWKFENNAFPWTVVDYLWLMGFSCFSLPWVFSFYGELLNDITNMLNIWEKQYTETVALANRKCFH